MIKIEFACKDEDYELICNALEEVLGSDSVNLKPKMTYRNFCGFYKGDESQTSLFNEVLKKYSEEGLITYYSIGHFNLH